MFSFDIILQYDYNIIPRLWYHFKAQIMRIIFHLNKCSQIFFTNSSIALTIKKIFCREENVMFPHH